VLLGSLAYTQQAGPPPRSDSPAETDSSQAPESQSQTDTTGEKAPWTANTPPSSARDAEAGESSSRDSRIDLSPPKDDAKKHPNSAEAVSEAEDAAAGKSDVQELHPWNPHKAAKDVEVGDFYFKKKNYRAAMDRYQEALLYKPNDAMATFHLAQCQEKLGQPQEAINGYQGYLKILPHGPFADEAQKSIERLKETPATGPTARK
jgi:tetratricopeptide (TPR) repeat protein